MSESKESLERPSGKKSSTGFMTLQKAVELGEYDPKYLANFPDWHIISRHVQSQLIRKGLENRWYQLMRKWADIANLPDFTKKPHLENALRVVERELKQLEYDREKLLEEYA
ncbi:MAG: hypothetical protein U0525_02885 [Patescibacteria group bacterium]